MEAAKRIFNDQSQKASDGTFQQEGNSEDEKILSLRSSVLYYLPSASQTKNLEWVRTAAQAALNLKLHGLLETAGYQSTSTKLQHASLPQFASTNTRTGMESGALDHETSNRREDTTMMASNSDDDGFDILPEPFPLAERSALCAGSIYPTRAGANASETELYSTYSLHDQDCYGAMQTHTSLGDMEVERDVDRLRDLLRRVDKSFASCCNALIGIGEHRRSRESLLISMLRSIDIWEGMRVVKFSLKCHY